MDHYMLRENGTFYILAYSSTNFEMDRDEKATVSYVSDGTTAYLSRVG